MSRRLRIGLSILLGTALLFIVLIGVLQSPPVRRYALRKAAAIVAKQGINLSAARLDYNLLALSVTLSNLEVSSVAEPQLPPILQAERVFVDLGLRPLLSGEIVIEDASVTNPQVQVVMIAGDRNNIPKTPPSDPNAPKREFFVNRLVVAGGSVGVEDRENNIIASLPLSQITMTGNAVTRDHQITLASGEPGRIRWEQRGLPLEQLQAEAVLGQNRVEVRRLLLDVGESEVTISGAVPNFETGNAQVQAQATLAPQLIDFAGLPESYRAIAPVSLKTQVEYQQTPQLVTIESLAVESDAALINGTARLALGPNAGTSTAKLTAEQVAVELLSRLADSPVVIASTGQVNLEATWPQMEFKQGAANAVITLRSKGGPSTDKRIPVSAQLRAAGSMDKAVVNIERLEARGARASGRVSLVDQKRLDGSFNIVASDLAQAGVPQLHGPATADVSLGGTIDSPRVEATIAASNLRYDKYEGIEVNAEAIYANKAVTIPSAVVTYDKNSVSANGTVSLAGRSPALNLMAKTSDILLASFSTNLSGTAVANARIQGTVADPIADVNVDVRELVAYKQPVPDIDVDAQIRNQLAHFKISGPVDGTGSYHLDTKHYVIDASTGPLPLTSMEVNGNDIRGLVSFSAKGEGTVENPAGEVHLSGNLLQVGDKEFGSIEADVQVANRVATIDADASKFNTTIDGTIGTNAPYPANLQIAAKGLDLAELPVKNLPVKGTVTFAAQTSGPLSQFQQQGQAQATVQPLDLKYNGQPIRSEGEISAAFANNVVSLQPATLVAGNSRLELSGTLPVEATAPNGTIQVAGTVDLKSLLPYIPDQPGLLLDGTAQLAGTIEGNLKRIDPTLKVTLSDGYFATENLSPPIYNASLEAVVENGAVALNSMSLDWGPASLSAAGTVPFSLLPADLPVELPRAQGPAKFTADLKNVDLSTVEGIPEAVRGSVSARLEAEASEPKVEAIRGKLTFPQLRLSAGTLTLQQQGTSEFTLVNGTATATQFLLTGPNSEVRLTGTAGLTAPNPLDMDLVVRGDASLVSAFTEAVRAAGPVALEADISGTAKTPQVSGFLTLNDGTVAIEDPTVAAESLNLRVNFEGTRATIAELSGDLNGGTISGGGSLRYADGRLQDTNLKFQANDLYMNVPEGLKTLSNANLTITNQQNDLVIGGNVVVEEGAYTEDLNINLMNLGNIADSGGIALTEEKNPMLERVRFNIGVRTINPIVIDNNLAEAEIEADVRVLGTPYETGLTGTVTIIEGGEIRLQERRYVVERGVMTFANERRIEPALDILATTAVEGFDVRLQVTGQPGDTETALTSDPPLPEPDILAMLLTGRRMDELRGQELDVARNQVLSYLTGSVGSALGGRIAGATGLSRVRIEPNLIAAETDPSARLTIGQDITRNLELIYSMDLVNSADQIYVAEYDVTRRFTTRGVRQSDGSFRFDFRHDVRFGGLPEPRRGQKTETRRIGNITLLGQPYFPKPVILDKLKVEQGDRYDFFEVRKGLDRLEKMYTKEGLLESNVRVKRQQNNGRVDLALTLKPGPKVQLVYEGISVPKKVREKVREQWQAGVFDAQRAADAESVLREWLVDEGYLRADIDHAISEPQPDTKRVLFDMKSGTRYRNVTLEFDGAQGIEPEKLRDVIKDEELMTEVYTDPPKVRDLLRRYYAEMGYLGATIGEPEYKLDAGSASGTVVFPVKEGPLYRVGEVRFEGNEILSDGRLAEAAPLQKGEAFRPVLRQNAVQRVREAYTELAFNSTEVQFEMTPSPEEGIADITFRIQEGPQTVMEELVVEGNRATSANLVRTQLDLDDGDILSWDAMSQARRNLYNTGAYSLVEMIREPVQSDVPDLNPVRLRVRVREIQPYELRYGAFYDTERGIGLIGDFSVRNLLGSARVAGVRSRWDSQLRELRGYFSQPQLRRLPLRTILSPYVRREMNPATTDSDPFNVDRVGFSVQQEAIFGPARQYLLNYGYRLERSRTYDVGPDPFLDIPLQVGTLTSTFARETRDDVLDATRGSFFSQGFEFSPTALGSDLNFLKYFGQYFRYFPLQRERFELFTNELLRPRLVFATGARLGLARGFGDQRVPLAERFFAGGSTTIRGFEQNLVGPQVIDGIPEGGQAMLIINNELRFPLWSIFDGVGFVDIGNVYRNASDISFGDLRKAAGMGLRVRTPWFLLRLDYGFKLDRRPGESAGRLFFSIGQAF